MSDYELTLADQAIAEAANKSAAWSSGQHEYLKPLRKHPLAVAELGRPRNVDHVHLSQPDGTDFVAWWGRGPSGYHHRIGRWMRLIPMVAQEGRNG